MKQVGSGIEYEIKVLNISPIKIRKILSLMNAKLVHKKMKYYRVTYELCDSIANGFIRVRKEDKNTTITTKIFKNKNYPEEYEIETTNSFEDSVKLLNAMGLKKKAYQESYRTKWILPKHKGVHEITIDELPGLPPYMEIDCSDKKTLDQMIKKFEIDEENIRTGSFDKTYAEYFGMDRDVINKKITSLTFKNSHKELSKYVKKNMNILIKMSKKQNRM